MQARLDVAPDTMHLRSRPVEILFGSRKAWMGATHFLAKGYEWVRAEMSLHLLAHNLRRVMNLIENDAVMAAMKA